MKKLTDLRNQSKLSDKDIDINNMPAILIMKRRAIRVFPDGQKVALYWVDKLHRFISVPYQSIGVGLEEQQQTSWAMQRHHEKNQQAYEKARDDYELAKQIHPKDPTRTAKLTAALTKLNTIRRNKYFTQKVGRHSNVADVADRNYSDREERAEQDRQSKNRTISNLAGKYSSRFLRGREAGQKLAAQFKAKRAQAALPMSEEDKGSIRSGINNRPVIMKDPGPDSRADASTGVTKAFGQTDVHGRPSDPATERRMRRQQAVAMAGPGVPVTTEEAEANAKANNRTKTVINTAVTIPSLIAVTEDVPLVVHYDSGMVSVTENDARKLLTVYEVMTEENKEKFVEMLNKDKQHFQKLLEFAQEE